VWRAKLLLVNKVGTVVVIYSCCYGSNALFFYAGKNWCGFPKKLPQRQKAPYAGAWKTFSGLVVPLLSRAVDCFQMTLRPLAKRWALVHPVTDHVAARERNTWASASAASLSQTAESTRLPSWEQEPPSAVSSEAHRDEGEPFFSSPSNASDREDLFQCSPESATTSCSSSACSLAWCFWSSGSAIQTQTAARRVKHEAEA
jgi:hypothetical protein